MTTDLIALHPTWFGPIEAWPLVASVASEAALQPDLSTLLVREASPPSPQLLRGANGGPMSVLLPAGLLVGGLRQDRMIAQDVLIPAGSEVGFSAICVEAGRFGREMPSRYVGRAPLRVLLAGLDQREPRSVAETSVRSRQAEVWRSVSDLEHRSGVRPTHSLNRVMQEDLSSRLPQMSIGEAVSAGYKAVRGQTGLVLAVEGRPLVMEFFASERLAGSYLPDLTRALAFDVEGAARRSSPRARISDFISRVQSAVQGIPRLQSGPGGMPGTAELDIFGTSDPSHGPIHMMAIDRGHPILQGVIH